MHFHVCLARVLCARSSWPAQPGQASQAWPGQPGQPGGSGQEASRLAGPGPGAPGRPTFFLTVEKKSWPQLSFSTVKKKVGQNWPFGPSRRAQTAILRFLAGPAGPGRPFCVFWPGRRSLRGHFAFFGRAGLARKAILRFSTLPTFFFNCQKKSWPPRGPRAWAGRPGGFQAGPGLAGPAGLARLGWPGQAGLAGPG